MGLFSSTAMALGYAQSRPPLHERIVALANLPHANRALDIGCGSGLSTRALQHTAAVRVGIEPVDAMVRVAPQVAPGASFVHTGAEKLPFISAVFDLLTAAGSLNYVDLDSFFPEARRVLTTNGTLLVYDFSQGRSFTDSPALDNWFDEFATRYPPPPGHARKLDPDILAAMNTGFRVTRAQPFEIPLNMSPAGYVDYAMTETNVANAIDRGTPERQIRTWCIESLQTTFGHRTRDVLFRGYFAIMTLA